MRDLQHYQRLLTSNPHASVGITLAAAAVYAACHGVCEAEHYGAETFRAIARRLKSHYSESLTVAQVRSEMQIRVAAQTLGRKGGLAGKGKRTSDCRKAALIRWAKYRAEKAKVT